MHLKIKEKPGQLQGWNKQVSKAVRKDGLGIDICSNGEGSVGQTTF